MRLSFLTGLLFLSVVVSARADIIWTNTTSGNFSDKMNWYPNQVPTSGDDVTLETFQYPGYGGPSHTIVINGQATASTQAESDMQTTILQLRGSYATGPFTVYSSGGLVELTGGGTMTADSASGLDLLLSGATLNVNSAAGVNCSVDGVGSTLQCGDFSGTLAVGSSGSATCGSIPNSGDSVISVDGIGSSLTVNGLAAPFQMYVTGGGLATAGSFSSTLLTVDGAHSKMQLNSAFAPPGAGFLTQLTITNGGEFDCPAVQITNDLDGVITGANSVWNIIGAAYLGTHAGLTVENGGAIVAPELTIDANQFSVQGTNSLVNALTIDVGESGTSDASVAVTQGGQMQSQTGYAGDNPSRAASVVIHDPGSIWINDGGALAVGSTGPGTLSISNAGAVQIQGSPGTNETLSVGFDVDGVGTVNIQDSGSEFDANTGTVVVGENAFGSLNISENANMDAGTVVIGSDVSAGNVTVSTSGTLNVHSNLYIDNGLSQALSGAQIIQTNSESELGIGNLDGQTGTLTVNGAGTKFNHTGGLMIVGSAGNGYLTITNGGELDVDAAAVGSLPGTGTVTMTGTNSLLHVFKFFSVGGAATNDEGPGTITVTNHGAAQVDEIMTVYPQGTVNLSGLTGGSINVGASNVVAPGVLRVSLAGVLECAGTVNGKVLVGTGGVLNAGAADGTCTINGDFELDSGGQLSMNLTGTTPSTEYDVLNASGNVSLAGTLKMNFLDGFAPTNGQSFAFLKFGTLSGTFSQVEFTGLAAGFQYQIQTNNNALVLVATSAGVAISSPLLTLTTTKTNLSISWLATATGYTLQSSTNLSSTNWVNVPTVTNQFSAPTTGPMQFFRLFKTLQ